MTQECGMLVLTHSSHRAAVEKKTQSPQGECAFHNPRVGKAREDRGEYKHLVKAEPGSRAW